MKHLQHTTSLTPFESRIHWNWSKAAILAAQVLGNLPFRVLLGARGPKPFFRSSHGRPPSFKETRDLNLSRPCGAAIRHIEFLDIFPIVVSFLDTYTIDW